MIGGMIKDSNTHSNEHSNTHSPRELARRYFAMWNTGDAGAAADILSATWSDHSHPEVSDPAGVQAAIAETRAARPRLRFEIETILAEGHRVCVVGGVGDPEHPGRIVSRLVWLFHAAEGRLTDLWTYRAA